MPTTTIKVPVELRDRLSELARQHHTTLAGEIARSLDVAEDAAFWDDVAATMGRDADRPEILRGLELFSGNLTDGLDPDEDWSDVW